MNNEWHAFTNERRRPAQRQPQYQRSPRPSVPETMFASREILIERKDFRIMLKENDRGAFVRIAEGNQGKVNSIMVPLSGLKDFQRLFGEMVQASAEIPKKSGGF